MQKKSFRFSSAIVDYYLPGRFSDLKRLTDTSSTVLITDENVHSAYKKSFKGWNTIVLKAGEEYKVQATVDAVIMQLIAMEADRNTMLVGVGGGVITDITGYVASVYMRGLKCGLVPTTLLAMVDAAIGGKNGIDVEVYKNMVGTIRQPAFILYDLDLLSSLPQAEWVNGFAEIIKHACIKDAALFHELEKNTLIHYRQQKKMLTQLVIRNAMLKTKLVQRDEFEKGERKLLNFGHTLGHALENQYELFHGQAVAIGMAAACMVSESFTGFRQTEKVTALLEKYGLPAWAGFNTKKVMAVLKMDKKRENTGINYVMLEKIGRGVIRRVPLKQLENIIQAQQQ